MRITKYPGKIWFTLEGKNPELDDDIFSICIEVLYKTKPNQFTLFSFGLDIFSWYITIINFKIGLY